MKGILTAALILAASLAHAACPEIPAAERVRIVECRSGYAVQEYAGIEMYCPDGLDSCRRQAEWRTTVACGASLEYAQFEKELLIWAKDQTDREACTPPNVPIEPVRVVE
jgi:murein endopeptidase